MSTPEHAIDAWQARNDAFLGAALAWLHLKLQRADRSSEARTEDRTPPAAAQPAPDASFWSFVRRAPSADRPVVTTLPLLPAPSDSSSMTALLDQAAQQMGAADSEDSPCALRVLCRRLGLSEFERNTLLLCTAMEFDTRTATLCARAQDDPGRSFPTFALAMALFDEPAWEALSPERPLRYWRLLEINQPGAAPLTGSALRADERIVNFIKGLNYLDDRLSPLLVPMEPRGLDDLPASQRAAAERIVSVGKVSNKPVAAVALGGRDRESKRQVAAAAAGSLGLHLYRISADALPAHAGELETLARLWQRESLLLPVALYIDAHEVDKASGSVDGPMHRVARFIARSGGLVFVDSRDAALTVIEAPLAIEIDKPTPGEQHAAWSAALGEDAMHWPAALSGQFNLNQHDIAAVAAEARQPGTSHSMGERLWQGCLARTRPVLNRLAEKIDAKANWDRIVLPAHETALLKRIAAQVQARAKVYDEWGFRALMNRGLGISALFAGESGTGKTMAAEVLANALNLDLYRIDLSAVVSKYIGETEKNLRQVFDAAEDGGAMLLFDEADALFGKRSEVKDSHDRYANIEIDYLLQRMEAYRGLALLATNMKSALDTAFVRRLRFIVNFPFPGVAERRLMWEKAFPVDAPVGVLDYERLARLNLTGGNIHGIALNAAFFAAQAGTPVTMGLVLEASRVEFRKLDRPVNEADFRWVEVAEVRA